MLHLLDFYPLFFSDFLILWTDFSTFLLARGPIWCSQNNLLAVSIPARVRYLLTLRHIERGSGAHTASSQMSKGLFQREKATGA